MPASNEDLQKLYDLAAEAGVVTPSAGGKEEMPWDSIQADPPPGPEGLSGTLTPPEPPGVLMGSPGALAAPGGAYSNSGSVGQGRSSSQGTSVGVSRSGINLDTLGKLQGQDKVLTPKLSAADAGVRADYVGPAGALDTAHTEKQDAASAHLEAQLKHIEEERASATLMKGLHDEFTRSETNIMVQENARKNQLMTQYATSLADFGASKIDPDQLWHGMSGGMRFGTMVTAFVHDFLGAQGIKTSAMDTLNTAIDRNISAQTHNIQNKLQVANGFKALYDMESARSSSAQETRTRIKGYMLESAKQHILANMSQYQSLLASAQGKEAIGQIDEAYAKNWQDLVTHIETASTARQGQAVQWEEAKLKAAAENYRTSMSARAADQENARFNLARSDKAAADQKKAESDYNRRVLIDPETNKGKFLLKEGIGDVAENKVRDRLADTAAVNRAMNELREMARTAGGGTIVNAALDGTRFNDETRRKYDGIVEVLAHSMVKANGERATEPDIIGYKKTMPSINAALTNGGIAEILANTHQHTVRPANDVLQQYTTDIAEKDQKIGPTNQAFEKSLAEARATEAEGKRGGPKPDMVDVALKEMSSPAGHKTASDTVLKATGLDKTEANLEWGAAFLKDPLIAARQKTWGSGDVTYVDKNGDPATAAKDADPGEVPTWAVAIMGLSKAAKNDKDQFTRLAKYATGDITATQRTDPALADFDAEDLIRIQHLAQYEMLKITGKTYNTSSDMPDTTDESNAVMYTGKRARAPGFNR